MQNNEYKIIEDGKMVKLNDGSIVIIQGNDKETTEEIEQLNYYVEDIDLIDTQSDEWYDYMIHRDEIVKVFENKADYYKDAIETMFKNGYSDIDMGKFVKEMSFSNEITNKEYCECLVFLINFNKFDINT